MRKDLEIIKNIIPEYAKILDIGCGKGELLSMLEYEKNTVGMGVEISNEKVAEAVSKGISVIHGDADNDLENFPDNSMEYAILSQTLQATKYPKLVIEEMLRIAKYAIISVPNFGYLANRFYLGIKGRMPVTKKLPYQWYDTPNIHFCTIKDFEILVSELNCKIEKKFFIYSKKFNFLKLTNSSAIANIFAPNAVFLIAKAQTIAQNKTSKTTNTLKIKKVALANSLNNSKL